MSCPNVVCEKKEPSCVGRSGAEWMVAPGDEQQNKAHKARRAGAKVAKAERVRKERRGLDTEPNRGQNRKAFLGPSAGSRKMKAAARSMEIRETRLRTPRRDEALTSVHAADPPLVIAVVGPPSSGKSTLIRSLVKFYSNHNLAEVRGPVTVVAGRFRRLCFVECGPSPADMCDTAKVADVAVLTIDGSYGLEMETFEFLSLAQVHGFPTVVGVVTHLDLLRSGKQLKKIKRALRQRFWDEVAAGAKVMCMAPLISHRFRSSDVLKLHRLLMTLAAPLSAWRRTHAHVLVDRHEDVTPAERIEQDPNCDRAVALYGFIRGPPLKPGQAVHVPGVGDFCISRISRQEDPCPPAMAARASAETGNMRLRTLSAKKKHIYAPYSNLTGVAFDEEALFVQDDPALAAGVERSGPGLAMLRELQAPAHVLDERVQHGSPRALLSSSANPPLSGGGGGGNSSGDDGEEERKVSKRAPRRPALGPDDDGRQSVSPAGGSAIRDTFSGSDKNAEASSEASSDDMSDDDEEEDDDDDAAVAKRVAGRQGNGARTSLLAKGGTGGRLGRMPEEEDEWDGEGGDGEAWDEEEEGSVLGPRDPHAPDSSILLARAPGAIDWVGSRDVAGLLRMQCFVGPVQRETNDEDDEEEDDDAALSGNGASSHVRLGGETSWERGYESVDEADTDAVRGKEVRAARATRLDDSNADEGEDVSSADSGEDEADPRGSGEEAPHDEEVRGLLDFFTAQQLEGTGLDLLPDGLASAGAGRADAVAGWSRDGGRRTAARGEDGEEEVGEEVDAQEAALVAKGAQNQLSAEQEAYLKKKMEKKAAFDDQYDASRGRANTTRFHEAQLADAATRDRRVVDAVREHAGDDVDKRVALLGGFFSGLYVRVLLEDVPVEFVRHFDPSRVLFLGGLNAGEEAAADGTLRVVHARLKRHRWFPRILKAQDPVTLSLGWRRVQVRPLFATEDVNGRCRYLKYTPQNTHCLASFVAPGAGPNTGLVVLPDPAIPSTRVPHFRLAATGYTLGADRSAHVVKKLKLTGTPERIENSTCFIRGLFNSDLEAATFAGARLRTVSGLRGIVKRAFKGKGGLVRCAFEDKLLRSDIVFLRTWKAVEPPAYCELVRDRLLPLGQSWVGMRKMAALREAFGVPLEHRPNSEFVSAEDAARRMTSRAATRVARRIVAGAEAVVRADRDSVVAPVRARVSRTLRRELPFDMKQSFVPLVETDPLKRQVAEAAAALAPEPREAAKVAELRELQARARAVAAVKKEQRNEARLKRHRSDAKLEAMHLEQLKQAKKEKARRAEFKSLRKTRASAAASAPAKGRRRGGG